jgi:ribonuclease VapC
MILDSSALVGVLLSEPGHEEMLARIAQAEWLGVGAPTLLEAAMVLSARLGRDARPQLQRFLREAEVEIVPFGEEHWEAAMDAFLRYGKGRHPARLNFGDCLAYAMASVAGDALLFSGDDFSRTDLG